jgi:hypothetical protein
MEETHNGRPITEINIASIDLLKSLADKNPRIFHSNLEEQTFLPLGTHYLIILRYIIVTCDSLIFYPDDVIKFFPINHFNYFKIFLKNFLIKIKRCLTYSYAAIN